MIDNYDHRTSFYQKKNSIYTIIKLAKFYNKKKILRKSIRCLKKIYFISYQGNTI